LIQGLDTQTRRLKFIPFIGSWAVGLEQLKTRLEAQACPKTRPEGSGLVIDTILTTRQLSDDPEILYSNCLEVLHLPIHLLRVEFSQEITYTQTKLLSIFWAFRKVSPKTFICFQTPPQDLCDKNSLTSLEEIVWHDKETIDGIDTGNLVAELLRKALVVKCQTQGLKYCETYNLQYFPLNMFDGNNRLKYDPPYGKRTWVNVVGQRKYWRPKNPVDYYYYLAPDFYIRRDLFAEHVVIVNIRVRFSNMDGKAFDVQFGHTLRKHLCKDWWNAEWLSRTIAICDFLGENGVISIGAYKGDEIRISSTPFSLYAPFGIADNKKKLDEEG
jgi:hypothetical protein